MREAKSRNNDPSARCQLIARGRVGAFSANEEDFQHATRGPVAGRPAYEVSFGIAGGVLILIIIFLAMRISGIYL